MAPAFDDCCNDDDDDDDGDELVKAGLPVNGLKKNTRDLPDDLTLVISAHCGSWGT